MDMTLTGQEEYFVRDVKKAQAHTDKESTVTSSNVLSQTGERLWPSIYRLRQQIVGQESNIFGLGSYCLLK